MPNAYIFDCLTSVNNQSLDKKEYEVIVILNGIMEPYYSMLHFYKQKYINFHLIYSEKEGVSNARNMGLEYSRGKYICFLDDDDILSTQYLELIIEKIDKETIAVSNVKNFKENIFDYSNDYLSNSFNKKSERSLFFNRKFLSNACCKLIPREIIGDVKFNEKINHGEDALFMFKISNRISKINKTRPECIYYRRLREGSASRTNIPLKEKLIRLKIQHIEYIKIFFSNPLKYNFLIFISRILATSKHLFSKRPK